MFTNIRAIEQKIIEDNKKIGKVENSTRISKDGKSNGGGTEFKNHLKGLNGKKKNNDNIDSKVEIPKEAIIVSSSLKNLIDEGKVIDTRVEEIFSKYPEIKNKY